jgi:hypothetical protein
MKVLIQNPLTLSYFQADHKWTADPDQAWSFNDSRNAVRFCAEHGMLDYEIVLKFPEDRYDVHMPAWAAAPQPQSAPERRIYPAEQLVA